MVSPQGACSGMSARTSKSGVRRLCKTIPILTSLMNLPHFLTQVLAATDASYMGMVYFDSSMMIITFVCAGECPQMMSDG